MFFKSSEISKLLESDLEEIVERILKKDFLIIRQKTKNNADIEVSLNYSVLGVDNNTSRMLYWYDVEFYNGKNKADEITILLGYLPPLKERIEKIAYYREEYIIQKEDINLILDYLKRKGKKEIYIIKKYGPAGIRTPDLQLRRLSPYPD